MEEARTLFHATDRLYRTTSKSFLILECRECRLVRLSPLPTPAELRTYYPPNYWFIADRNPAARLEELYRRFVLWDHVRFVERAVESSGAEGPVLDVGCGGGLFLRMLSERGYRVTGLDLSLDAARAAWDIHRVPALVGDLPKTPLRPGSFAALTMFHVLEHLYDPAAYLEAAGRLLAPNGRLIVQVPNAASWQFVLFGENWNGIDVPRHLINFTTKQLDSLLDYCGFEVLRHKHFSLRDNPAGFASSLVPSLDPMARRVRQTRESAPVRLIKDAVFFGLTVAAVPFTILEAACRAGSTVMIEARKRA